MKSEFPRAVKTRFRDDHGQALLVEVRDYADGALMDVMGVKDTAIWLETLGFRWVDGSNGIWIREVAHG